MATLRAHSKLQAIRRFLNSMSYLTGRRSYRAAGLMAAAAATP